MIRPSSTVWRESRLFSAFLFATVAIAGVALIWWFTRSPPGSQFRPAAEVPLLPTTRIKTPQVPAPDPKVRGRQAAGSSDARVLEPGPDGIALVPELAEQAKRLNDPQSSIEDDFEILESLVEAFRHFNFGENPPGGENDEIVSQLRGGNLAKVAVIPPDLPQIDGRGRLLDRWGTPFYFHPVSYDVLEIRSAGPDGQLWTADDVTGEGGE